MTDHPRRAVASHSCRCSELASAWSQTVPAGCRRASRAVEREEQSFPAPGQEDPLSEINWAVELRKIEREFDGLPPEPTPTELRQKRQAEQRDRNQQDATSASFGVYFRLTLVICLGISLVCWPYEVTCGGMLFGYLAAVIVFVVGGIWTALATFTYQMPYRHLTALVMILWGLTLGAAEILPRIGYASPTPGRVTAWSCAE